MMPVRTLLLLFFLMFGHSASAADYSLFYEDNQVDYRNWGARFDSPAIGDSRLFGLYPGVSVNVPTVVDSGYLTAFGHLKASLFPGALLEPYASVGIDLIEFGVIILTDGEAVPQVDTQISYGLRINLGRAAIDLYQKSTHLTGFTIVEGIYHTYGIGLTLPY